MATSTIPDQESTHEIAERISEKYDFLDIEKLLETATKEDNLETADRFDWASFFDRLAPFANILSLLLILAAVAGVIFVIYLLIKSFSGTGRNGIALQLSKKRKRVSADTEIIELKEEDLRSAAALFARAVELEREEKFTEASILIYHAALVYQGLKNNFSTTRPLTNGEISDRLKGLEELQQSFLPVAEIEERISFNNEKINSSDYFEMKRRFVEGFRL